MSISGNLIYCASKGDFNGTCEALSKINYSNKHNLYKKNSAGFNPIQAIAASNCVKYNPETAGNILFTILNKSIEISNPEEHREFITQANNAGFTPLHSAVNRKNYYLSHILFEKTVEAYGDQVAGGRFATYLLQENNRGKNVYDTYNRNCDSFQKVYNSPHLEDQLFGQNLLHQQYLASYSNKLRTENPDDYSSFYV